MMSFAQREGAVAEWGAESEFLTLFPTSFPILYTPLLLLIVEASHVTCMQKDVLFLSFGGSRAHECRARQREGQR